MFLKMKNIKTYGSIFLTQVLNRNRNVIRPSFCNFIHFKSAQNIKTSFSPPRYLHTETKIVPQLVKLKLPCNQESLHLYLHSLSQEYEKLNSELRTKESVNRKWFVEPILNLWDRIKSCSTDIFQLQSLIKDLEKEKSDTEMLKLAYDDLSVTLSTLENLYDEILEIIVPPEEIDDLNILVELNAGVGGQEAMLFTQEMTDMYRNFASFKGWSCDTIEYASTEIGGIRHATLNICGHLACKYMKFESGVHRVQRVPKTEKSGRIHTSTMTVAILPQPSEIQINLDPKDIKLETMRASGAGGQHVNKTESAVRITHLPSGIVVRCEVYKSQHQNQELAKIKIRAMLYEKELGDALSRNNSSRKSQVGTAGRSEKVRTYNFVQDRITDHRLTKNYYNMEEFLSGNVALNKLIEDVMTNTRLQNLNQILEEFKN